MIYDNRTKYIDDDGSGVKLKQKVRKLYNYKYQQTYGNISYVTYIYYLKDTIIRLKYSGRKRKSTGFVYLKGSPYRDAEG